MESYSIMHMAFNKAMKAGATVILVLFVLVVLFSLLAGCSSLSQDKKLQTGCDLICKDCKEVRMSCNQDWDVEHDTETQGTISGPSIGG